MSRSVTVLFAVLVAMTLVLPAMAQGGPPPGAGAGAGAAAGAAGGPAGGPAAGRMMAGMGQMMAAPPTIVVSGDYVFVAWLGQLSQYKVSDLSLVKTVTLPMPQAGMMMRGGHRAGGEAGAQPAAPAE